MNIKKITTIALLSAVSFIVSFIAFPIIPSASFLKIDFSDNVLLLIALSFGFKPFVLSAVLKGALLYLTGSDIIGATTNIMAALLFVGGYYLGYKQVNRLIKASVFSTLFLSIGMSLLNYFIFLPLYVTLFQLNLGDLSSLVVTAILPFNVIKGLALSLVNFLLLPKLKFMR